MDYVMSLQYALDLAMDKKLFFDQNWHSFDTPTAKLILKLGIREKIEQTKAAE